MAMLRSMMLGLIVCGMFVSSLLRAADPVYDLVLRGGTSVDVTVFSPQEIADKATYETPF